MDYHAPSAFRSSTLKEHQALLTSALSKVLTEDLDRAKLGPDRMSSRCDVFTEGPAFLGYPRVMIWHPPAIFVGPATNISLIFRRANRSLTCSLLSCVCHSSFFGFVLLNEEELEPTDYGSVPMEHGVRVASASTLSHTPNHALGSLCTVQVLREGDSIRRYDSFGKGRFSTVPVADLGSRGLTCNVLL